MYQVVTMYGDNEPWWFFDNWQEDITQCENFSELNEAQSFLKNLCHDSANKYGHYREKEPYLFAFWNDGDIRYCEECEEDLQQYFGVLLLKDNQLFNQPNKNGVNLNEAVSNSGKTKCCKRLGQGAWRHSEE